jgi:hypothetical protein
MRLVQWSIAQSVIHDMYHGVNKGRLYNFGCNMELPRAGS